jgi:hypothetical protein
LINSILHKKITKKTNWLVKKNIKCDKIITQLIQRKFLNIWNTSTLKSINMSENANKNKVFTTKSPIKNLIELAHKSRIMNTDTHFLKHFFLKSHDENSEWIKKENSTSYNKTVYRTLSSYTHQVSPKLYIPKKLCIELMRSWGMLDTTLNKPVPNKILFRYHDLSIILHYKNKAMGLLEYYRPARNLCWLKKQINYHMRYSLLFTLAKKHKTSTSRIIQIVGKNTSIYIDHGNNKLKQVASFLTSAFINNQKAGFSKAWKTILNLEKLKESSIKTSVPKALYHECQIKGCTKNSVKIFHLRAFYKKISPNTIIASMKIHTKKIHGAKIVEYALRKKQIPLCRNHHLAIYANQLFIEDIQMNSKSFKLLNSNMLSVKF